MMNSERANASKREDDVDLISRIPDAILHLILSSLRSTKEAIRTSILSTRWRYLWTSVPSLHIDCFRGSKNRRNFKKDEFKEFVYWVLVNKTLDLDSFHLSCSYYYSMSTVGRWIHAAVTRNVKQLDLSFRPIKTDTNDIELPHCLVTCSSLNILRLDLDYCGLHFRNFKEFEGLRVLNLTRVLFTKVGLKDFFESCPVLLEDLTLFDCWIFMLDALCISCPKLKNLSIINMENLSKMLGLSFDIDNLDGGLKISCPKLEDLDLIGHVVCNFFFECLDSLNKAVIQPKLLDNSKYELMYNSKYVLFPGISHVEYLLIDLFFFSLCIDAARDPALPNLKTLVLTTTIDAFTFNEFIRILKYYPKVESLKLIIKEEFDGPDLDEGDERIILISDLKKVGSFEFNGEKPKLVTDWHEFKLLEMGFSWGKKPTNL